MDKKPVLIVLVVVLVVFAAGFYLGRFSLQREWANPVGEITPGEHQKAAVEGADPTPEVGVKVVRGLPLKRMRQFMATFVEKDPVVMTVGSVGRDDEEKSLNLVVKNRGKCKVTRVVGVAYGYDARGRAVRMNKGGEPYVAFDIKDLKLDPDQADKISAPLKDPSTASLAVAQIDQVDCADGTHWKRA